MGMEGWDAAGGEAEAVVSGRFDRLEALLEAEGANRKPEEETP